MTALCHAAGSAALALSRRSALAQGVALLAAGARRVTGSSPDRRAADAAVDRALEFLHRSQASGGSWEAAGGMHRVALTSLAAMPFLMTGSTLAHGPSQRNIQDALNFVVEQARPDGLIGDPGDSRCMYGHGFGMLFLASAVGDAPSAPWRDRVLAILQRATAFSLAARTSKGGWGYLPAARGRDFDEGSVTITQLQGLRACRDVGVAASAEAARGGQRYIEASVLPDGGVRYSLSQPAAPGESGRPAITAAAAACLLETSARRHPLVDRLRDFAERALSAPDAARQFTDGHWHYAHYYFAQVAYREGAASWARYRQWAFPRLLEKQRADGAWDDLHIGPVYATALLAAVLLLERDLLPIYQR